MPPRRITMQDIADACGLSRNTVSKVFNGHASVPPATRELVRQKARELGYGFPVDGTGVPEVSDRVIAVFTRFIPDTLHFGTVFLTAMTDRLSRSGHSIRVYQISWEEIRNRMLPPLFDSAKTEGIVSLEIFDRGYVNMLCQLKIPMVLTDSPVTADLSLMECDCVTMENQASTVAAVRHLAEKGARRIGFVGDSAHCLSFQERWRGFRKGLQIAELPLDHSLCIREPDNSPYDDPDWILSRISRMPSLPDAFVCANDYLAIHLLMALKKGGYSVPEDVMITGFDDTAQSAFTDPPLSTIRISSAEIGAIAADVLINRIKTPSFSYTWTRVKTTPVWRRSSRD